MAKFTDKCCIFASCSIQIGEFLAYIKPKALILALYVSPYETRISYQLPKCLS